MPSNPNSRQKADATRLKAIYDSKKKALGITQASLADDFGFANQSAVGQYLNGVIPLNPAVAVKFAKALGCEISDFSPTLQKSIQSMAEFARFDENVKTVPRGKVPIPVIDYIQAGRVKEQSDPYPPGAGFDIEYCDDGLSKWAFALEIEGESMLPDFRPGDRVIIEPEWEPRPGEFVAAKDPQGRATFKKYRPRGVGERGDMVFELVPLNEDFPIMRSDRESLSIIGVMAEHRKKARRR